MVYFSNRGAGWLSSEVGRQNSDNSGSLSNSHRRRNNNSSSSSCSCSSSGSSSCSTSCSSSSGSSSASSRGGSRSSSSSGTGRSGCRSRRSTSSSSSQWPTTFGCSPQYQSRGSTSSSRCSGGHGNRRTSRKTSGSGSSTRIDGGHVESDVSSCSSSDASMSAAFCKRRCRGKRCSSCSVRQGDENGASSLSLISNRRKEMNVSSVTSLRLSFLKGAAVAGATGSHMLLLLLALLLLLLLQSDYKGSSAITPNDDGTHIDQQLSQAAPAVATESEILGARPSFLPSSPLPKRPSYRLSFPSEPSPSPNPFEPLLHFSDRRGRWQLDESAAQYSRSAPRSLFDLPHGMQADPTVRAPVVAERHQAEEEGELAAATAAGRTGAAAAEGRRHVAGWLPSPSRSEDFYQKSRPLSQQTANAYGVIQSLQDASVTLLPSSSQSAAPLLPTASSTLAGRGVVASERAEVQRTSATAARNGDGSRSEVVTAETASDTILFDEEDDETSESSSSSSNSLPYFKPLLSAMQSSHRCQQRHPTDSAGAAARRYQREIAGKEVAGPPPGHSTLSARRGSDARARGEGEARAIRAGGRDAGIGKPATGGAGGNKWFTLLPWKKGRLRSHNPPPLTEAETASGEGGRGEKSGFSFASLRPFLSTALHALNLSALDNTTAELTFKAWQQRVPPHLAHLPAPLFRGERRERTKEQSQQRARVNGEHVAQLQRGEGSPDARHRLRHRPLRWTDSERKRFAGTAASDRAAPASSHRSVSAHRVGAAAPSKSSSKQQRAARRRSRLQTGAATSSKLFIPIGTDAAAGGGTKRQRTTEESKPPAAVQYHWPPRDSTDSESSVGSTLSSPPFVLPSSTALPSRSTTPATSHAIPTPAPADISTAAAADSPTSPTLASYVPSSPSLKRRHPASQTSYNASTPPSPAAAAAWSSSLPETAAAVSNPHGAVIYPATFDRVVFGSHLSSADSADAGAAVDTGAAADAGPATSTGKTVETAGAAAQNDFFLQSSRKSTPPADAGVTVPAAAHSSHSPGASSAVADIAALSSAAPGADAAPFLSPPVGGLTVATAAGEAHALEEEQQAPQREVMAPEKKHSGQQVFLATQRGRTQRSHRHGERGAEEEDAEEDSTESTPRLQAAVKDRGEQQNWNSAEGLQLAWARQQQGLREWQLQQQYLSESEHQEEDDGDDELSQKNASIVEQNGVSLTAAARKTPLQQQKRRAKALQMQYMQRREARGTKHTKATDPTTQPPLAYENVQEQSTKQQRQRPTEQAGQDLNLLQQQRKSPLHWRKNVLRQEEGDDVTCEEEGEQQTAAREQRLGQQMGRVVLDVEKLVNGAAFLAEQTNEDDRITRESNSVSDEDDTDVEEVEDVREEESRKTTGGGGTRGAAGQTAGTGRGDTGGAAGRTSGKAAVQNDTAVPIKTAEPVAPTDTLDVLTMLSATVERSEALSADAAAASFASTAQPRQSSSQSASLQQQQPRQRRATVTEPHDQAEGHASAAGAIVTAAQQSPAGAAAGNPLFDDPTQQLNEHEEEEEEEEEEKPVEAEEEAVHATAQLHQEKRKHRRKTDSPTLPTPQWKPRPRPPPPSLRSFLLHQRQQEQEQHREWQRQKETQEGQQQKERLQQHKSSTLPPAGYWEPTMQNPFPQPQRPAAPPLNAAWTAPQGTHPLERVLQDRLGDNRTLSEKAATLSRGRTPQRYSLQQLQDAEGAAAGASSSVSSAEDLSKLPSPGQATAVVPPYSVASAAAAAMRVPLALVPPYRAQIFSSEQLEQLQRFVRIMKVKDWYTETTAASILGRRPAEEDAFIVQAPLKHFPHTRLKAIFDGHGGAAVSRTCASVAHTFLGNMADLSEQSFTAAALRMDDYLSRLQLPGGSTGLMAVIEKVSDTPDFKVHVANVGDSRGMLLRLNRTYAVLSRDHRPHKKTEKRRILKAGGYLTKQAEIWRVNGRLAVSRAFGDFFFKRNRNLRPDEQIVSAVPEVHAAKANPGDVLLLACDGMFEMRQMDWHFVARMTYAYLQAFGGNLEKTADALVNLAYQLGSKDNISVSLTRLLSTQQATPIIRQVGLTPQGETVQIVDRTPGFQATIEPTSFSTEGFAYENPDCDLTRRLRYRTAFFQAKPSHIFWRRDVKRDMIDGRKYTFINPTEEELDASNSVEFCIVVTAPSPVPEPADPDVVFRRRLQEIPEPDEHTLTIVIHSAASCLGPSFPLLTALVMAFVLGNILI